MDNNQKKDKEEKKIINCLLESTRKHEESKNKLFTNLLHKLSRKCICCGGPGHDVGH